MIKPKKSLTLVNLYFNTTKFGLIRLSVYNSVFNLNRGNNQFLYSDGETWARPHNKATTPGAYELTEIAELIKEETNVNVIIEPDKNTMKWK